MPRRFSLDNHDAIGASSATGFYWVRHSASAAASASVASGGGGSPPPPGWIEFLLDSTGIEVVPIKRVFFLNMDSIGFIKTVTSSVLGLFWISFFSDWIGWTRFFFHRVILGLSLDFFI